ncbi:MAG TPA: hypothetical protein VMJ32_00310 [Pirellulales bacterium]|nr:hypothetical protein [Pirellulales bacterium]
MPTKLSRIAPIAVIAGILGYLSWPYFDDPTAISKSKNSDKSAAASLASLLNPSPAGDIRDGLFEIPQSLGAKVAQKASTVAGKSTAAKKGPAADARRVDEFKNFTLSGTYVAGGSRFAVINGSLYAEGEQITASGKGAKAAHNAYTVAHVDIDKVVLSFQGETKELHYADPLPTPEPKANSAKLTMSADRSH